MFGTVAAAQSGYKLSGRNLTVAYTKARKIVCWRVLPGKGPRHSASEFRPGALPRMPYKSGTGTWGDYGGKHPRSAFAVKRTLVELGR